VADKAGVAISTVSRVLNGLDRVADETRVAILRVIDELEYVPNIAAKTLKAKRSKAIGVLCEDITSPYTSEVIRGIESTVRELDFNIILCDCNWDSQKAIHCLDMLLSRDVDSIIYSTPLKITDPLLTNLIRIREEKPFILISEDNFNQGFFCIETNVEDGMRQVMQHLFDLGHHRIAMIGGPENSGSNAMKIRSYSRFITQAGYGQYLRCMHTDFSLEQGMAATRILLSEHDKKRPSAIIGAADLSIIGAIKAAKNMGFLIPKDISLVGWGGIIYSNYTDPPLTTISVPRYNIGVTAAKKVLSLISASPNSVSPTESVKLPVSLIVRETTGPALD
jgi:DNA-binding LacI/PurR family transcriptional regulator